MPEEQLLREVSRAALDNADTLLTEARLLHRHSSFARALSLSILGQEEVGKALIFAVAALGLVPETGTKLEQLMRDHATKQQWERFAVTFAGVGRDLEEEAESGSDATSQHDVWAVQRLLSLCSRAFADKLESAKKSKEAAREHFEMVAGVTDELRALLGITGAEAAMTPDQLKMAGFYVDVADGKVRIPSSLRESQAATALSDLSGSIRSMRHLRRVLEEDDLWGELEQWGARRKRMAPTSQQS